MNVASLASSVLVQYALVSVTGNEWKYIGGVPLEGEALIKQTASAVDSNMNGTTTFFKTELSPLVS